MSIFNFLLKKSKLVSNKSLVPFLTKNITEYILESYQDILSIASYEDVNSKNEDPSLSFSIEQYSCYSDSNGSLYAWILVEHGERNSLRVNLINYHPKDNTYISLFDFEFANGVVEDYRFGHQSSLYKYENSTQQCMDAIKIYANFNAYKTSPPYVVFAKMIDLTK